MNFIYSFNLTHSSVHHTASNTIPDSTMPELPEVETTLRGITPHILNRSVSGVTVRNRQLRWPVPSSLNKKLTGQKVQNLSRRAKYLLLTLDTGTLILHLGMSGSLRIVDSTVPAEKHDHVDIHFDHGMVLRLRDPRRFGAVLWTRWPLYAPPWSSWKPPTVYRRPWPMP